MNLRTQAHTHTQTTSTQQKEKKGIIKKSKETII